MHHQREDSESPYEHLLGRKPLLLVAIVLFTAGSVVGAMADTMTGLIAARAVQGLGGGGLMILSQATIADVVPARERGRYMGAIGGVFAFSSVAGPLLGGWFTEGPGWRWAFWMNLPLGALTLLSVTTTALVLVSTWGGHTYAWDSALVLGLALLGVAAAVLFVVVESRAAEPVMPLALFRDRDFNLSTVASLATGIAMFGAIGYMPTYLQMATGADATTAGLLMIPMMGALLLTSIVVGQVVSRTGRYKAWPIAGSLVVAVGLGLLSTLEPDSATALVCTYLAVMGGGLGASMQLLTLIVQNAFPLRMVGTATAASTYFRQVGATLGAALVGSIFTARLTSLLSERLPASGSSTPGGSDSLTPAMVSTLPDALRIPIVRSYNDALIPLFLWMVPLGIVGAVALLFLRETPLATTLDDAAPAGPARPAEDVGGTLAGEQLVRVTALDGDGDAARSELATTGRR